MLSNPDLWQSLEQNPLSLLYGVKLYLETQSSFILTPPLPGVIDNNETKIAAT